MRRCACCFSVALDHCAFFFFFVVAFWDWLQKFFIFLKSQSAVLLYARALFCQSCTVAAAKNSQRTVGHFFFTNNTYMYEVLTMHRGTISSGNPQTFVFNNLLTYSSNCLCVHVFFQCSTLISYHSSSVRQPFLFFVCVCVVCIIVVRSVAPPPNNATFAFSQRVHKIFHTRYDSTPPLLRVSRRAAPIPTISSTILGSLPRAREGDVTYFCYIHRSGLPCVRLLFLRAPHVAYERK